MKKIMLIIFLFSLLILSAQNTDLTNKINKYAGKNAENLINLLETSTPDTLQYINFILENSSPYDLAILNSHYLMKNLRLALKSRELPFTENIPDDIFYHFVLPLRISQEPLEDWRQKFYYEIYPLVADANNIDDAVQIVNWWVSERIKFIQTNGRDQGPITSLRRGYGRCEEIMIFLIAALRSVGIPARSVSAPYWNRMDNNHAWEEVWTPEGWKFMAGWGPSNIPEATWFSQRAATTTLVTANAFGNYSSSETINQEDNVTLLSAVGTYTEPIKTTFIVVDENDEPVENAYVMLYGISFGGLFPMMRLNTDKDGSIHVPMGRGGCFVSAAKDSLTAYNFINLKDSNLCKLQLSKQKTIDLDFEIKFPPPLRKPFDWQEPQRTEEHKLRSEIAGLRFDRMWNNRLQQQKFLDFYDQHRNEEFDSEDYLQERKTYLEQTANLAGSTSDYLTVIDAISNDELQSTILLQMITDWDIKELVELPDSASIHDVLDILAKGKTFYSLPDSIWRDHVLNQTFGRVPCPENGWRSQFYQKIKDLANEDLSQTYENVVHWVDNNIEIDSTLTWTYFTGVNDPNQMLNMHYISESERLYLINYSLTLLGVPTKWTGFLNYYSGEDFVPMESNEDKPVVREKITKTISVYADGEQIKAEPWNNFLIAQESNNGVLRYGFFEETQDSLDSIVEYFVEEDSKIYIESYIRNTNGDAHIVVKSLTNDNDPVTLNLSTPIEFFNNMRQWDSVILDKVKSLQKSNQPTLIFVNNKKDLEPQQRMLDQIRQKKDEFTKRDIAVTIYSEKRNLSDEDFDVIKGDRLSSLDEEEYPLIFLLDENGNLIYSVNGYYMGIADLLLRQIRPN